ncbi:hypothetical protein [Sphingomonas endolithica]|uniref:hypothetical protein n=1 Tax=Sphingomonas endolithica TaxID=2972485 RepID=UPI0021AEF987|nr:hypothetical protein [Sphingomonas sp. ZFBP2030]
MSDDHETRAGEPDIPPENGKRPSFRKPIDERLGAVGTGGGYSGQEYDSEGQEAWRAEQDRRKGDPDGAVDGSGVGAGGGPGEDFDSDAQAGGEQPPTGR